MANMTEYSTAVGPSSVTRKRSSFAAREFIESSFAVSRKSRARSVRETRRTVPQRLATAGGAGVLQIKPRSRSGEVKR
jgi:hypothetical protein